MTLTVSACLLAYNHEHLIAEVLEAILAQTYRDFELLVSDDCSTDGTWEAIQSIAQKDARIKSLRTPRNLGMAGNVNFAARFAAGRYIALLHHDDIVAPSLLERWLEVAMESERVGFVFNDYAIEGAGSHASERREFTRHMPGQQFLRKHLLGGWGCPVRGTALINRSCFDSVGGMDERFQMLADVDLWMRLASRWDVGYVDEPLIRVMHRWPRDYPEDYTRFSWRRLVTLFDIHARNLADNVLEEKTFRRGLRWWAFRGRVSAEAAKWLVYALIRDNKQMLLRAGDGANAYEWWPIAVLRKVFGVIGRLRWGVD